MKANQGSVVEEAQKQPSRLSGLILSIPSYLQEENEAMKANQGSVVEEAQKQLEVTRIDIDTRIDIRLSRIDNTLG